MAQGVLSFQYEAEKSGGGMTALAGLGVYFDLVRVSGLGGAVRRQRGLVGDDGAGAQPKRGDEALGSGAELGGETDESATLRPDQTPWPGSSALATPDRAAFRRSPRAGSAAGGAAGHPGAGARPERLSPRRPFDAPFPLPSVYLRAGPAARRWRPSIETRSRCGKDDIDPRQGHSSHRRRQQALSA